MEHKRHTVWFVGGGTAGHVMPLLAVADVLKHDKTIRIVFIGETNGREATLAKQAGLPFYGVSTGKIRRYLSFSAFFLNGRDMWRFGKGVWQSYRLIQKQKPQLIFFKGGPVSLPVAIAARLQKVPFINHESDAIMGGTNRLIARFSKQVLTGFPATTYPAGLAAKVTAVGIPLRSEFCTSHKSGHHSRRPMILVTGGSQGAVAINETLAAILPKLLAKASVMHIVGDRSYARFLEIKQALPPDLGEHYGVIDFTPDIASYMREATLVITRASSTIFEVASLGKPMILIPLPSAANNHQLRNAEIFVAHHAALMLRQDNLTPDRLYETIASVLDDTTVQHELKEGTRAFASCDAAKRVAEVLKQYLH